MMAVGRSIQLARIFGIRVGATPSWFFVLFVMIVSLNGYFSDVVRGSNQQAFLIAVAAALLFGASIVVHELGHALAARRYGIETSGVDLWFFGGLAKLDREPDTPGREFAVAIAGPLVTALVALLCAGGAILASSSDAFVDSATLADVAVSPGVALLGWLATVNVVVFVFNMLPAYPLDGGRIAKAIAWRVTGDRNRGLRVAARMGQFFAYALIALGIYLFVDSQSIDGIWFAVLGWLMAQAARGAVISSNFQERIDGVTVGDLMDTRPAWLPAQTSVLQAHDDYFAPNGWPWLAVAEETGAYRGVLTAERVDGALAAGQPALTVRELLDAGAEGQFSVETSEPLTALLGSEGLRQLGALMVVDAEGYLRGVVTVEQIRRALAGAV
ncbi:MAG TPA: site-2 protease family protein [Solirubrobacteraceae bacterium]